MYRCAYCKKPFVVLESQKIEGYTSDFMVFVTPCCKSLNFSELNNDFLIKVVDGKQKEMTVLSKEDVNEYALQWAKDFVEENEKAK